MAKVRRLPPVHPGEVLREDLMTPLGLSIVDIDAAGNTVSLAGRPENIPPVAEPGTLALLAAAFAGVWGTRRRRS